MNIVTVISRRGFGCKKEDFSIFGSFFGPKFPIWTLLLAEPLEKKARGQRPNL